MISDLVNAVNIWLSTYVMILIIILCLPLDQNVWKNFIYSNKNEIFFEKVLAEPTS